MGRRMLGGHGRRKHKLMDTPYQPLEESPDKITDTGSMQKRRIKTKGCRNTRESAKSNCSSSSLARRAIVNNATNGQSCAFPMSETNDFSESSFVTISSGDLDLLEDSDAKSEDNKMEYEQSQCATGKTFRRLSAISVAPVGKLSTTLCKIRDKLTRRKTSSFIPPVSGIHNVRDSSKRPQKENVKPDAAMSPSSKNPLKRMKRAHSLYNETRGKLNLSEIHSKRGRRWSLFSTGYAKLENSDSSPSMGFSMENAVHSTFVKERVDHKTDKPNYGRELQDFPSVRKDPVGEKRACSPSLRGTPKYRTSDTNEQGGKESGLFKKNKRSISKVKKMAVRAQEAGSALSRQTDNRVRTKRDFRSIGETNVKKNFPKAKRNDLYNLRTLSVRSSGGNVKVTISLELSDPSKRYTNSPTLNSESRTKYKYIKSYNESSDITPKIPKRPLSRKSLFFENELHKNFITGQTEMASHDDVSYEESFNKLTLNIPLNAEVDNKLLSPNGEIDNDQLITPPNSRELIVSMAEALKRHAPRMRKRKGLTC